MRSVAILSMHTSPLVQPGTGDSGGMNVYVRELRRVARPGRRRRAGVRASLGRRRCRAGDVEPGLEVVHVRAGPPELAKEHLPSVIDEFADGVAADLAERSEDVLHANYWLSAVAAHRLKHELDLPLVATFHTLARVKAEGGDAGARSRESDEVRVIGCCDAICASNPSRPTSSSSSTARRPSASSWCRPGSTMPSSRRVTAPVPATRSASTTARRCCSSVASSRSRA